VINLLFALALIAAVFWAAKKFYFPTEIAQRPEKYPVAPDAKVSRKDLATVLFHLQRWRKEGKISREEYDHMTDICLSEMQQIPEQK
jgi:hypothetical protein